MSGVTGGKGGGKPVSAQGSGDKCTEVNEVLIIANDFAKMKFL